MKKSKKVLESTLLKSKLGKKTSCLDKSRFNQVAGLSSAVGKVLSVELVNSKDCCSSGRSSVAVSQNRDGKYRSENSVESTY